MGRLASREIGENQMPGAVLRVVGEAFDPGPILEGMSLQPYAKFRKGEKRFPDNPRSEKLHPTGGFKCDVSSACGVLADQVMDAIAFLQRHYNDLARLRSHPDVEAMSIDFGYHLRMDGETVIFQSDSLPPELLRLTGESDIGIDLSLYPKPGKPA
jgi:hypothetical protein